MFNFKNVSWETTTKKEFCRVCTQPIQAGTIHAVFVKYGRNKKGYSYNFEELYCAQCGVNVAKRVLCEVEQKVAGFLADAPGAVIGAGLETLKFNSF